MPTSTTAGSLATLQQPIIGEDGFNARTRPQTVPNASFDVTFDVNVTIPTGWSYYVRHAYVGLVGARWADSPLDVLAATQAGESSSVLWWAFPEGPKNRLPRLLQAITIRVSWVADLDDTPSMEDNATISVSLPLSRVRVATVRATFGATPTP